MRKATKAMRTCASIIAFYRGVTNVEVDVSGLTRQKVKVIVSCNTGHGVLCTEMPIENNADFDALSDLVSAILLYGKDFVQHYESGSTSGLREQLLISLRQLWSTWRSVTYQVIDKRISLIRAC